MRRPRSQRIVSTSRTAGDTYAFRGPAGSDNRLLRAELLHRFDWIWEYNIAHDLKEGLAQLEAGQVWTFPRIRVYIDLLSDWRSSSADKLLAIVSKASQLVAFWMAKLGGKREAAERVSGQ